MQFEVVQVCFVQLLSYLCTNGELCHQSGGVKGMIGIWPKDESPLIIVGSFPSTICFEMVQAAG